MWRELVEEICVDCILAPPASSEILSEVEAALGVAVPDDLRSLWLEANGIRDRYGDGVWSAERVITDNLEMRSYPEQNDLYMPFDPLFFFASEKNGDMFFFPIQAGGINRPDVYVWKHETDSRVWVTGNLRRFVEQWFSRQLVR